MDTDFLKVYSQAVTELPKLTAEDVAEAVYYALETPDHVQIEDITLQAMRRHNVDNEWYNASKNWTKYFIYLLIFILRIYEHN